MFKLSKKILQIVTPPLIGFFLFICLSTIQTKKREMKYINHLKTQK